MIQKNQPQKSINSSFPKLADLSNRIKFLNLKHSKIDDKILSYIKLLKNTTTDSVENQQGSELSKNNKNGKSQHQLFRTSRKFNPKKKFIQQNSQKTQLQRKENMTLSTGRNNKAQKNQKINSKFIQKSINTQSQVDNQRHLRQFQFSMDNKKKQIKGIAYMSRKMNNYFIDDLKEQMKNTYRQKQEEKRIQRLNQKQQKQEQKREQKLKVLELKRQLLEEEQKSIRQFENCVLYKQKLAERLRHQQQLLTNRRPN